MSAPAALPAFAAELDAMISRAEAACERHRRQAMDSALSPRVRKNGLEMLVIMEQTLARLQAQRDAAGRPAGG